MQWCHVFQRTNMLRWVEVGLFYRFLHFEDEKMHKKAQLHCPHPYPASPSPSSSKWTCVRPVLMTMTTTTATSVFLGRGRQHWTRRMSSLSRLHLTKGKKQKTASTSEPPPCSATLRLPNQWNQCPEGAAASERAEAADGNLRDLSSGGHSAATAAFTFVGGTENPKKQWKEKTLHLTLMLHDNPALTAQLLVFQQSNQCIVIIFIGIIKIKRKNNYFFTQQDVIIQQVPNWKITFRCICSFVLIW